MRAKIDRLEWCGLSLFNSIQPLCPNYAKRSTITIEGSQSEIDPNDQQPLRRNSGQKKSNKEEHEAPKIPLLHHLGFQLEYPNCIYRT
ncbi:Uncharacterized protein TCM_000748 [Theobroma cacao]|uniref:Uncharacterized protein n=1 Tax=Theobroma cacao TaxID=3641 RepID=A0A061DGX7_THECC|nr:Uncharacterized protein TCM_000748 [Theobroma cacao]